MLCGVRSIPWRQSIHYQLLPGNVLVSEALPNVEERINNLVKLPLDSRVKIVVIHVLVPPAAGVRLHEPPALVPPRRRSRGIHRVRLCGVLGLVDYSVVHNVFEMYWPLLKEPNDYL